MSLLLLFLLLSVHRGIQKMWRCSYSLDFFQMSLFRIVEEADGGSVIVHKWHSALHFTTQTIDYDYFKSLKLTSVEMLPAPFSFKNPEAVLLYGRAKTETFGNVKHRHPYRHLFLSFITWLSAVKAKLYKHLFSVTPHLHIQENKSLILLLWGLFMMQSKKSSWGRRRS